MPLFTINADDALTGAPDAALAQALARSPDGPIVILIHGYKFSPDRPKADPHRHILALQPRTDCPRAVSWPRHLGFGQGRINEGLCLSFGWQARGMLWRAYRTAGTAGVALARLVARIHALAPGRRVDLVAHSLGARVFLSALPEIPAAAIGRAILIAAAEVQQRAEAALACPAGRAVEVFNITSRENDIYDFIVEWMIAPHRFGARALGHGLSTPVGNWLDLQMDDPRTLAALRGFGFRIAPAHRRICHWSGYLRPGMFPLYRALLRDREALPLSSLRAALPTDLSPRWSRLLARRTGLPPLSSA